MVGLDFCSYVHETQVFHYKIVYPMVRAHPWATRHELQDHLY